MATLKRMHDVPVGPIVSMINSANEPVSKWLFNFFRRDRWKELWSFYYSDAFFRIFSLMSASCVLQFIYKACGKIKNDYSKYRAWHSSSDVADRLHVAGLWKWIMIFYCRESDLSFFCFEVFWDCFFWSTYMYNSDKIWHFHKIFRRFKETMSDTCVSPRAKSKTIRCLGNQLIH